MVGYQRAQTVPVQCVRHRWTAVEDIAHLTVQVGQFGDAWFVDPGVAPGEQDRDHFERGPQQPGPGCERCRARAGMVKAVQPHARIMQVIDRVPFERWWPLGLVPRGNPRPWASGMEMALFGRAEDPSGS